MLITFSCAWVHAQEVEPTNIDRVAELKEQFDRKIAELELNYQRKIFALSHEVTELKTKYEESATSELETEIARLVTQEHDHSGHVGHFHNDNNPAISLTSDFVLSVSDREDSSNESNQFIIREIELSIQGYIDAKTTYHLFFFLSDDELEVEEGYGVHTFDHEWMTGVKAGRFNTPFTPVSRIHSHDLPFVDFPGVVQEFLGGNFRGTGIEFFHRVETESGHSFRLNFGVVNALDGDSHTVNGPLVGIGHGHDEDEDFEAFGERSFENFSFYAHAEGHFQVGESSELRIGSSVAFAPQIETTFLNEIGPVAFEDHTELDKLVASVDIALHMKGPDAGESFVVAAEFFFNRQSFLDETTAITESESAFGLFVWTEYRVDSEWAFGASVDLFERAEDSSQDWWDAGFWITWNLSESNRLRMELRYFDDSQADEYWGLMLQWVTTLGTHEHSTN
jgi:hypothetical protein